jgi:hypothetical protein
MFRRPLSRLFVRKIQFVLYLKCLKLVSGVLRRYKFALLQTCSGSQRMRRLYNSPQNYRRDARYELTYCRDYKFYILHLKVRVLPALVLLCSSQPADPRAPPKLNFILRKYNLSFSSSNHSKTTNILLSMNTLEYCRVITVSASLALLFLSMLLFVDAALNRSGRIIDVLWPSFALGYIMYGILSIPPPQHD